MNRRVVLLLGTLSILGFARQGYCDEIFKILHIQCSRKIETLQITPFYAYNAMAFEKNENNDTEWKPVVENKVLRREDSTFYLAEGEIRARCSLRDRAIAIQIRYNKPSARGQCGGNPVGFMNVTENGAPIVEGEVVHNCSGANQTGLLFDKAHGWQRCIASEKSSDLIKDSKRSCTGVLLPH